MCKPILSFQPVSWAPGFHSAKVRPAFSDLYLFHLRYFDLNVGLARLRRTRTMAWAQADAGAHQRVADEEFNEMMQPSGPVKEGDRSGHFAGERPSVGLP